MKIFNLTIPFTEPGRKDREIENLEKEVREKDLVLSGKEACIDQLLAEKRGSERQQALLEGQLRVAWEKIRNLEEQNASSRKETEVYRAAIDAVASGSDQFPGQERMLELARQATRIMRDSQQSCSLSYELYAVQICDEADRIIPKLNEKEAKFFEALLGGDYTPPHERGPDWQREYEIRQELYREMYGEEEPYENDEDGEQAWSDDEEDDESATNLRDIGEEEGRTNGIGI
jgi:hypothetical protein